MTRKPTSLFARIARLLYASDRGRTAAAPWGDLAHQLVSLLGMAAVRWLPCRLCTSQRASTALADPTP
jgi:hypothetical protein